MLTKKGEGREVHMADKALEENEHELVIVILSLSYQIPNDQPSSFLSIIC